MKLENILKLTQENLKNKLAKMFKNAVVADGYIYVPGNIPVMVTAHLDTVHKAPPKQICYSNDGNILMSPQGIGGDDRVGVWAILQILKTHKPHVLFCEDEEAGAHGARKFIKSGIEPDIKYIIGLDRRGKNDAVFYDCANEKFTEFVTSFGFKETFGSFSDISIIAPALSVAAVNLSVGFFNEHTKHEYIDLSATKKTIKRVKLMLETKTEKFEYIPYEWGGKWGNIWENFDYSDTMELVELSGVELMELSDSDYIVTDMGDIIESGEWYFMDDLGKIYTYIEDLELLPGYTAYNKNNLPVRFDAEKTFIL